VGANLQNRVTNQSQASDQDSHPAAKIELKGEGFVSLVCNHKANWGQSPPFPVIDVKTREVEFQVNRRLVSLSTLSTTTNLRTL
jgi:hypothetical protein